MTVIPYGRQSINQEDIEAVCEVLRSDRLTQGPKVREFEEALCRQCGARHCIVVASGTLALHLACLVLDVRAGDVGLTSPVSFLASANCVAYCGGTPDFADIDPQTLCLSPAELDTYCRNHPPPGVVIPVDFAGIPAPLPALKRLAQEHGFKVLEDAAHAIGSTYEADGKVHACGSCSHSDAAVFSFHPVKTITTGEGGAILTNDDGVAERARDLANHGTIRDPARFISSPTAESSPPWYHEMQVLGYNGRITDIQCALGLSQLRRLERFKARRQEIVRNYNRGLKDLADKEIVLLPPWPAGTDPCYHLYPLRLGPKSPMDRDALLEALRGKGIHCQVHYIPIYRQPFYQRTGRYRTERFPEAETYFRTSLSLPLFPGMDEETFRHVLGAVFSLLNSKGRG